MTCKDCIHYEVCENGQWYETPCVHYKNKADFVEVVRCQDCTHSKEYPMRMICHRFGRDTTENAFCSYGERVNYESSKTEKR